MPTLQMVITLLNELAAQHFCGSVEIEFHGGAVTEIHKAEAQKLTVGAFRPQGLETR